jgi:8-oxo-dGTP pyrophosphatase MutT (NUDIX family)
MAFPGGRQDPSDADDLATAKRETLEEVGMNLDAHAVLLGQLDDIAATARGRVLDMAIAPFVFSVETVTPIVPTAEAVATFWTPVQPLLSGDATTTYWVDLPEGRTGLPAWNVEGNVVWGLTFRMMSELFSLIRP